MRALLDPTHENKKHTFFCFISVVTLSNNTVERQNMEGTNRPGDKSLTDGEPRKATYVEVASRRKNGGR